MNKSNLKRTITALLVLLVVAACGATYLVLQRAKHYYIAVNAVRLDPLGLRQFEWPSTPENLTLAFYGDSRAEEWPEPIWLEGRTVNLGISAQTTEQILGRFDHHVAPLRPDFVLLQAGINDLKTIALFPTAEAAIVDRCKQNLRSMVDRCRALGSHVILTTIFPGGELPLERRPFWSDRIEPSIDEVNQYIQSLASDEVTVIVTGEVLTGEGGHITPENSRDFLHLSARGYERLNEALRDSLEPILSVDHPK